MAQSPSPTTPQGGGHSPATLGFVAALSSFMIWGLFAPVYFKQLGDIGAVEIVAHRVVWTVVLVGAWLLPTRGLSGILRGVGSWRRLGVFLVTTALIATNWTVFIWAIGNGRLVESSLGYYINPIINVLLGMAFLNERLSRRQGIAVLIAAAGVLSLVLSYGSVPWVAFALALSFGFYALVRKKAAIDPMIGLMVETALLVPPALGYLLWLSANGTGNFGMHGIGTDLLMVMAGPVTAVPLVLFMIGAARLTLSTLGVLQYVGPTGQLLLGVLVYGEAFTASHAMAFACIWAALALYSADALFARRDRIRAATAAE
ncbi:EamA family transporter RarD [Azospirillum rugosum]|uniref:Chloramphenicol-sensitive protein RarD n=1 Tax=Azospirillum rugosum TaxID=416170 RepID=A0ABS4SKY5_9PROT|nr:EamA family transporter RarD [Azospirillum rugosum]MBP2293165.1 chloramphenicol-sensitive protein RarD [Azospirillum rugosum]MDQ0526714.1 chloramphenicol-sensitive protein RarD [Azospirillum rugosum]